MISKYLLDKMKPVLKWPPDETQELSESPRTAGCQFGITDEEKEYWDWFQKQKIGDISEDQFEKWKEINKRYLKGMIEYYSD